MLRIQIKVKPYKMDENNSIEILATSSSIITLFSMILLVEEDCPIGFHIIVTVLMFVFNGIFVLQWTLLFLISWNVKNAKFQEFIKIYSTLVCKRSLLIENHAAIIEGLQKNEDAPPATKRNRPIKRKVHHRRYKVSIFNHLNSPKRTQKLQKVKKFGEIHSDSSSEDDNMKGRSGIFKGRKDERLMDDCKMIEPIKEQDDENDL